MTNQSMMLRRVAAVLLAGGMAVSHVQARSPVIHQTDARDAHFAHALYYHYQDRPYDALATFLGNPRLELQATGAMNVLLSDLYARYGLVREADAALNRIRGSDVLTSHRNAPWLRYGKLLYQNQQNSLALNLLRQPPLLISATYHRMGRAFFAYRFAAFFYRFAPFFIALLWDALDRTPALSVQSPNGYRSAWC